ncbi:hypothetical protein [Marichromatium gracile]|uniref:DUF1508 domain-containing protein n=1 Tax=Marichromatium gracile TaxID=1048 RepID=A0ABR5VID1_MARGR|nr:hypothetical protein [Marichromatium gracile]KXX65441.1 hypothetical protein AY586_00930 [Marichromatium gracile]
MPLEPLHYRMIGQDDYAVEIRIDATGDYCIENGDYTSHAPRRGCLDETQRARLQRLTSALGAPDERPAPTDTSGFIVELSIGEGATQRRYRVWEGALAEDPELEALVRALEVL